MPKYALPHKFSSSLLLLDELPAGASGYVYKAKYTRDTQSLTVVVKFFDHPSTHDMLGYFTNEQLVLRELNHNFDHPHLVQYVTHDLTQQPFYLVTRYVPDAKALTTLKPVDISSALLVRITTQVASALDYLHAGKHTYRPVIHRDVKPDNILLDNNYNAVLIDLSIARHPHFMIADEKTMGTPSYMAPEQYEGAEVPASDQFSLAVVVYELLTGQVLLSRQPSKAYQNIKELHDTHYARVSQTLGKNYIQTSRVLCQALAYDPAERFTTCTVFANSLKAALEKDGHEVDAPIVVQQHPVVVGSKQWLMPMTAVLAVFLLGVAIWAASQFLQSVQAASTPPIPVPTITLTSDGNLSVDGKIGSVPPLGPTVSIVNGATGEPDRVEGRRVVAVTTVDARRIDEPLRREPSYDAAIIGAIPLGAQATFLGGEFAQYTFVWYQVEYNGIVGWCRSLFCQVQ